MGCQERIYSSGHAQSKEMPPHGDDTEIVEA
jgi:hypothetical protein